MSTLSICVIAKNEEEFLEESLRSISPVADEIIFVDTGSSDRTLEIAKKFTNNIHYFKWINDFSAAYNSATDRAKTDYIFRWDADYFASAETISVLKKMKTANFDHKNIIAGKWVDIDSESKRPTGFVMRDMIYRRGEFRSSMPIHSFIKPVDGVLTDRLELGEFVIEHHKNKSVKNFRYSQSYKMLKSAVTNEPTNAYLLFHLVLAYIYDSEFELANEEIDNFLRLFPDYIDYKTITLLEKKLACLIALDRQGEMQPLIERYSEKYHKNTQFLLLEADVLAISNPKMAKQKYLDFIKRNRGPGAIDGPYIYSRYEIHPLLMLSKLESDEKVAQNYQQRAESLKSIYHLTSWYSY